MRTILLFTLLMFSSLSFAQGNDSQPSFAFGNNLQGTNGVDGGNVNAVQAYTKLQEQADAAYKDKDYDQAYKLYHRLAEYGDKFSQYRIAYMHQKGYGVEKNMIEALAWSYVSAEKKVKGFVNYHVGLKNKMSAEQVQRGLELGEEYLEEYGLYSVAYRAKRLIKKNKKRCTGSRVGSSCDRVSSSGITCNAFENNLPGKECLTLGAVGLPAISGIQPKDLRLVENNLTEIMRTYSPGTVELRDLEIIKDEKDQ